MHLQEIHAWSSFIWVRWWHPSRSTTSPCISKQSVSLQRLQRLFLTSLKGTRAWKPLLSMTPQKPPQSTSRRSAPFFQKRLANKQMLKQRVKHYYRWLHCTIHLKTKISQSSPDSLRIQGPSKRSSSGHLYSVSSVKERHRKGGKM